jgi:hypothetical protein
MKKKALSIISILVIAALSACGPAPTPTISAEDQKSTAIANAWLSVTQTQLAMPTATETPVPPTPVPTDTPAPIPTIEVFPTLAAPAATATEGTDPCNQPAPVKPLGTTVSIKLLNKTNGTVSPLSFGMTKENDKKECGTYTFSLGPNDEQVVKILAGCYWGYGFINGTKPSTPQTPGTLCLTDPTKTTAIWITADLINFH